MDLNEYDQFEIEVHKMSCKRSPNKIKNTTTQNKKRTQSNVDNDDDNYSHKNYLYKRHKSARVIRITGNKFCATLIPRTDFFLLSLLLLLLSLCLIN